MNQNASANGRNGPTTEPMLGRFPSTGSTSSGHSNSNATAPAEGRSRAAPPTPSTAASTANSAIAPTRRQVSGSANDRREPASGGAIRRPTTTAASVITGAYTPENTAATLAFPNPTLR